MNRPNFRSIIFLILISVLANFGYAQSVKLLDDFDNKTSEKKYSPEGVVNQEGYDVYFQQASIRLSRVAVGKTDKALRIEYKIFPSQSAENWASIRKEFDHYLDLSKYDGLKLDVKVEVPSDALLRVTLADINGMNAKEPDKDELWWFDCPVSVLKDSSGNWVTLQIPFDKFRLSYGIGSRHNDEKMDLSRIVAYEINVVSGLGKHSHGALLVNSLVAYKSTKGSRH